MTDAHFSGSAYDPKFPAGNFAEHVTAYDKNSNILGLGRYGQTGAGSFGLIDSLTYSLQGNRITRVDDAATASAYGGGFEFKDAVKQDNEYVYDADGNLTKDLNKGIVGIQYNYLNLPNKVTFGDGSTITYTYAADGTKLRTLYKVGSTTTTTNYCGSVIYENGVRKYLLTEEGYVSLSDGIYHYFYRDHLGNVRLVMGNPTSSGGQVEERNDYYPFGGLIADLGSVQPYKYNGKELDTKKGLNWYDYGARMYDAALGRWHKIDPMTEKYYSVSPYAYCSSNPVNAIDYQGKLVIFINGLHNGFEGADPDYWKMKNHSPNFDQAVMDHFKDWNSRYYDGSLGGIFSLSYNMQISTRFDFGYIAGLRDVKDIISKLARDSKGNIIETIKIISHSMGGAYAKGFLKAVMEYIQKHPEECNGINLAEYDFAPYQPGSQTAIEGVDTYQYSHKKDNIAGNTPIRGAKQMDTYSDEKRRHSLEDFFDYIKTLPEGSYKIEDGKIVKL